ncbi:MAG TPA: ribose-phosphate pyrophosphokinase [Longimicrobiales bacterium]
MAGASLFAGTAHPRLAEAVARALGTQPGACAVERFPDGEVSVRFEEPIRGRDVHILQPTSPPVDAHLMELLAMADAARRAGARRVVAIVPYFGYARSDSRHGRREPLLARLVADLLETAGVDEIVTLDPHTDQLEGFFRIPMHGLTAVPVLVPAVRPLVAADAVVVSPDAGRVEMAGRYAAELGTRLAVLHKRRQTGAEVEATGLSGDVRGRDCILIDDMISTGGTLVEAARVLREAGAKPGFIAVATHGLLVGRALEKLVAAGITRVLVTDSVAPRHEASPEVQVVPIAPLIAEALRGIRARGTPAAGE